MGFTKKEWYDVKTPAQFSVRNAGKTLVSKSQGLKLSTDGLKGRVLECNLADLNNDDDQAYRKIKLEIQEVQGRNCLTDFHGMSLTRDKQMRLVRKWHSLIEAHCKVKTTDGYILRMFCIPSRSGARSRSSRLATPGLPKSGGSGRRWWRSCRR